MINRFMISVAAAALIAGTGFANAQGTGMSKEAPSAGMSREAPAAGAQQAAPSSDRGGAASMSRDAAEPAGKQAQSEPKSAEPKGPAGARNQRADDSMKSKNMSAEQDQKSKTMGSEQDQKKSSENDTTKGGRDMKAEERGDRNNNMNAETKTGSETKSQTVGQAGAATRLSTEQRTKISSVIKEQHIQSVTNVNFSISVGTRVPRDAGFHPLPPEIVTIYPDWRGYDFILVHEQIVVIDPSTYEIVAVIDA